MHELVMRSRCIHRRDEIWILLSNLAFTAKFTYRPQSAFYTPKSARCRTNKGRIESSSCIDKISFVLFGSRADRISHCCDMFNHDHALRLQ